MGLSFENAMLAYAFLKQVAFHGDSWVNKGLLFFSNLVY